MISNNDNRSGNNTQANADETLMAFADGELDAVARARMERALQADPAMRQRVDEMVQQRDRVAAAFATVLAEPVPDRLAHLLQTPQKPQLADLATPATTATPAAAVVNLADARKQRAERIRTPYRPTWAQLGGLAASIMLGVLLGTRLLGGGGTDPATGGGQGQLVAGGAIDKALSTQLASEPVAGASVAVQLSFVDKGGNYCRTYSTATVAGLACRQAGQWVVQQEVASSAMPTGEVRQAATALPPALLDAVDKRMAHGTLDGAAERAARAQGWRQ